MKNKALLLALLTMLTLVGCSNNIEPLDSGSVPDSSEVISKESDSNKSNTEDTSKENYYYQIPTSTSVAVDIGIENEVKKFKEPYQKFGATIKTPEYDEQQEEQEIISDVEQETEIITDTSEEIPPIEYTDGTDEEDIITEDIPLGPSEEDIKSFNLKKLAYEVNYDIVYDIYQNGILLLDNVTSEKEFNKNHKVTLDVVLSNTQKNIERIEEIGNNIRNNFGANKELEATWNELYTELRDYRDILNKLNNTKDVISNKDNLGSKSFSKIIYNFSGIMEIEIKDYKPEMQLQQPVNNTDYTSEVGGE